jgi:chemotaxis signal transduction protein
MSADEASGEPTASGGGASAGAGAAAQAFEERLLTFEVGGSLYALPIANVLEVADVEPLACIPTLPASTGGVVNLHGDALPVIRRAELFDVAEAGLPEPAQLLVVAGRPDQVARLGVPVDRIAGLVDGSGKASRDGELVAERRPIGGRVVGIVDPRVLVARAREAIERALGPSE